jgi:hypothetical protein
MAGNPTGKPIQLDQRLSSTLAHPDPASSPQPATRPEAASDDQSK